MGGYLVSRAINISKRGIPAKIKVGKATYKVFWCKGFSKKNPLIYKVKPQKNFYGMCNGRDKQIFLADLIPKSRLYPVVFHELLHAVSYEFKLNFSEKMVRKLQTGLTSILRQNIWAIGLRDK